MGIKNAMSGKDVQISFRQNNIPVVLLAKSISVEEVADESVDEVCGEKRGRPQTITDYFKIRIEAYAESLTLLDAHLADIANADANGAPLNKTIGIKFTMHDATKAAYVASEGTRSPFKLDSNDRKSRVMQTVEYKFRFFKSVAAA